MSIFSCLFEIQLIAKYFTVSARAMITSPENIQISIMSYADKSAFDNNSMA